MIKQQDAERKPWTQYRYVFIVTYGRSGSTLLQSLMNSCPGVQIRGENHNALFHLHRALNSATETRKFGRHPQTKEPDEPWFGASHVKPVAFEGGVLASFVRNVLAPDPGTDVTGFKEIRYNRSFISKPQFAPYMDFLLTRFPQAKVVFNSRRASDVAKSAFFAERNSTDIADWVAEADHNFAAYNQGSDKTIHMQYEDYVEDHRLVHQMLDFLNLNWTAEAVERVFAKPLTHAKD